MSIQKDFIPPSSAKAEFLPQHMWNALSICRGKVPNHGESVVISWNMESMDIQTLFYFCFTSYYMMQTSVEHLMLLSIVTVPASKLLIQQNHNNIL